MKNYRVSSKVVFNAYSVLDSEDLLIVDVNYKGISTGYSKLASDKHFSNITETLYYEKEDYRVIESHLQRKYLTK